MRLIHYISVVVLSLFIFGLATAQAAFIIEVDIDGADDGVLFEAVPEPVSEPATMLLLGTGLVGLVGIGRKKFFKKL